jgi:hypothetical protein
MLASSSLLSPKVEFEDEGIEVTDDVLKRVADLEIVSSEVLKLELTSTKQQSKINELEG